MRNSLLLTLLLTSIPAFAASPTEKDLLNDAATPGNITTYGGGYNLQRHSPLKQIDRSNVGRLVPVWNLSLANNYPQEGQPLLIDGVMYETTTDATVAANNTYLQNPVFPSTDSAAATYSYVISKTADGRV